ncbi:MAG: DUF1659 domain-containing protein [Dethiobacter sp.]|jgi:hypothetical protein|nr:DUF1659 domain-containing protein [Dethiobacter sp.]MBS3901295.1 DUF1659 domain-containing protein [Dethiobacter sp.]MBS3988328.1 DUF1659 domain-containing protein [Dethiobacter sp.]
MAIILEKNFTRCQVSLQDGTDEQGNPILVNRLFGRIFPDTTHQDLYDVVQAIMGLQELPVRTIRRLDDGELVVV